MTPLVLILPEADRARLADIAARAGVTPEEAAAAAVKARIAADNAARAEIEAGVAELDDGLGLTLEDYEQEMDAFMSVLQARRD